MATNFYFNNFGNSMEQRLLEDLVIESIKIYGHDVMYLPMKVVNKDQLYGEVAVAKFDVAYPIEMYIKNVDGFGGEGSFLSKFNLEIRDEIEFSISLRTFSEEVGVAEDLFRPREGDLIWFPLAGRMFKISYVSERPVFYQLGTVAFADIRCQMFEYSNERITTGIIEIDQIAASYTTVISSNELQTQEGYVLTDEDGYTLLLEDETTESVDLSDNDIIQTSMDGIIDFSEIDPFSEGVY